MAKMAEYIKDNQTTYLDSDAWIHFIEEHLDIIKNNSTFEAVDPDHAWRFRHDFAAYLYNLGISLIYHYPMLRINGFLHHHDFDENVRYLFKPTDRIMQELTSDFTNTFAQ